MSLIIENGSNVPNANSYVTTAELTAFAAARGVTLTADPEQLLIQAMDYLESLYFKGIRINREQSLQWPRYNVYLDTYYLDSDEIPQRLKDGQMQVAIAIDQGNNPLQDAPRATKEETVGPLTVVYADGASSVVINKKIMATLGKLLASGGGSNVLTVNKG